MSCPDANAIARMLDGHADAEIEAHLDTCAACSQLVADLASMIAPPTMREWAVGRSTDEILAVWLDALVQLANGHAFELTPDRVAVSGTEAILLDASPAPTRLSGYLALERLVGAPPWEPSDQFAACVAIWETLAGSRPFAGATAGALAVALQVPPEIPEGADRKIFSALLRGLLKDPTRRWSSIAKLAAALR